MNLYKALKNFTDEGTNKIVNTLHVLIKLILICAICINTYCISLLLLYLANTLIALQRKASKKLLISFKI